MSDVSLDKLTELLCNDSNEIDRLRAENERLKAMLREAEATLSGYPHHVSLCSDIRKELGDE